LQLKQNKNLFVLSRTANMCTNILKKKYYAIGFLEFFSHASKCDF